MISDQFHKDKCCDILKKYIKCISTSKRPYNCHDYLYFFDRFKCI